MPIDVLVNNAGYAMFDPFIEMDTKRVLDMLQVNIMALTHYEAFSARHGAARSWKGAKPGVTASFLPGPLMACYYASKAYVLSFSEAIANDARHRRYSHGALPGPTETGFQKRASIENSRLIKGRRIMDAATVARIGYKALMAGKPLVIPGLSNKLILLLSQNIPTRRIVPEVVKRSRSAWTTEACVVIASLYSCL